MPIPLVERSESYIAHRIRRRIRSLGEVADCAEVLIGYTRKKPSIRLEVKLKGNPAFEGTHRICSTIEDEVRRLVSNSHIDISSQSSGVSGAESVWKAVRDIGEIEPGSRGTQNIHLNENDAGLGVDFLFVRSARTSGRHGGTEAQVEQKIRAAVPRVREVAIHFETLPELISSEMSGSGTEARFLVEHVVKQFPELKLLRPPAIQKLGAQTSVDVRVAFTGRGRTESAVESISNLESAIKKAYPAITKVDVIEAGVHRNFTAGSMVSDSI